MFRQSFLVLLFLLLVFASGVAGGGTPLTDLLRNSQSPVMIEAEISQSGKEMELVAYIKIPSGSHIYSIQQQDGVIPTNIIPAEPQTRFVSKLVESSPLEIEDQALDKKVLSHKNIFELRRKIQPAPSQLGLVYNFFLHYQICDNSVCSLPVKTPFSASLLN